ncbi:MAG: cellulase family glycosylhydrolase [Oscillospiraceae bacterium]
MKMKKFLAVLLAAVMCVMCMSLTSFAATKNGISLNKTSVSIAIGKSYTLKPTLSGMSKATVQWSSSDKSVATVSKGKVTAKGIGTAKITVKVKDTSYKAECTVKVVRGGKISSELTGQALVDKIKVGINLASALEVYHQEWMGEVENELDYETLWSQPRVTEKYFTTLKKAGFNAVRIPVTWQDHMDKDGNISKVWLDRVQEVVDYAYDNGMYVIINVNHEYDWMLDMSKYSSATAKKFEKVWKQIATRFKNYDERLILESMGEPRTPGSEKEWSGGTAAERKVLNKYHKVFVDTVRATGGNNKNRCLIIPTYGAKYYAEALNDIEIPNNDNKVIVDIHAYEPWDFTLNYEEGSGSKYTADVKAEIDNVMNTINDCLVSKGIPVIMGECGAINKNNTSDRIKYAKYYISSAKELGIPCLWWENGFSEYNYEGESHGLMDRTTYEWYFPELTKAIIDAAK